MEQRAFVGSWLLKNPCDESFDYQCATNPTNIFDAVPRLVQQTDVTGLIISARRIRLLLIIDAEVDFSILVRASHIFSFDE